MIRRILLNMVTGWLLAAGLGLQAADMPSQEQAVPAVAAEEQELAPAASEKVGESQPAESPGEVQAQAQQTAVGASAIEPTTQKIAIGYEIVLKGNDQFIPGFKKEVFLGEVAPMYQELILKALARLMQDFRAVQAKNYTPDVIPGTIYAVLANVLKGKDAQDIAGFMNATYMAGLGYLTNGAATLFVATQLPTTFKQHLTTGIKSIFCMGSVQPDDVLEKAADMQVNKEV